MTPGIQGAELRYLRYEGPSVSNSQRTASFEALSLADSAKWIARCPLRQNQVR